MERGFPLGGAVEPGFPEPSGEPSPWRLAGRRGIRYAPTTPAQDELFRAWVLAGDARPFPELKGGVFRAGELVVKFFRPPSGARRLRGDTAHRAARIALELAPLATPRPLLAVGGVGRRRAESLLVTEFVPGAPLDVAWDEHREVRRALPRLLAAMHERSLHHGDLHPGNLIWDGTRLFLIDVTAMRRGLHLLFAGRLVEAQWARLLLYVGDVEGLRQAFLEYARMRGRSEPEAAWRRVVERTRDLIRRWPSLPPRAPDLSREG